MHMMLMKIFCIAHAEIFRNYIMKIVTFKVFDYSQSLIEYYSSEQSEALDSHFEALGYESSHSIINMGSTFFLFIVAPVLIVLIFLVRLCFPCSCCQKFRNFLSNQLSKTVFNRAIVIIEVNMLVMCTSAWINIYQVHNEVIDHSPSYYTGITLLALFLIYSLVMCVYLCHNYKMLSQQSFTRRVGSAYSYLATDKVGKSVLVM